MKSSPRFPCTHISTYYTPPRKDVSASKAPLFVRMSDSLVDLTDDESIDSDDDLDVEECEGFIKQSDGKWLHAATGVYMSTNPFE